MILILMAVMLLSISGNANASYYDIISYSPYILNGDISLSEAYDMYNTYNTYGDYISSITDTDDINLDDLRSLRENRYGYLDARDLGLFLDFADEDPYDKFEREYYEDLENVFRDFYCIEIEQYNELAELDSYDRYTPIDLDDLDYDIIDREFLRRLDLNDYNLIADADNNDWIDSVEEMDVDYEDTTCWDLDDYNYYANLDNYDRWDEIDFTDFDDLNMLTKIGRGRVDFFDTDDFIDFNLDLTQLYPVILDRYDENDASISDFFSGTGGFNGTGIPDYYLGGGLSEGYNWNEYFGWNPNFKYDFDELQDFEDWYEETYVYDHSVNHLSDGTPNRRYRDEEFVDIIYYDHRSKYGYGFRRPR